MRNYIVFSRAEWEEWIKIDAYQEDTPPPDELTGLVVLDWDAPIFRQQRDGGTEV
jgi:hypothetical protein